jgi:hypothetical protein
MQDRPDKRMLATPLGDFSTASARTSSSGTISVPAADVSCVDLPSDAGVTETVALSSAYAAAAKQAKTSIADRPFILAALLAASTRVGTAAS